MFATIKSMFINALRVLRPQVSFEVSLQPRHEAYPSRAYMTSCTRLPVQCGPVGNGAGYPFSPYLEVPSAACHSRKTPRREEL